MRHFGPSPVKSAYRHVGSPDSQLTRIPFGDFCGTNISIGVSNPLRTSVVSNAGKNILPRPILHLVGGFRENALHNVNRLRDGRLTSKTEFVTNLAVTVIANPDLVSVLLLRKINKINYVPIIGSIERAAPYDCSVFQFPSHVSTTRIFVHDPLPNRLHYSCSNGSNFFLREAHLSRPTRDIIWNLATRRCSMNSIKTTKTDPCYTHFSRKS